MLQQILYQSDSQLIDNVIVLNNVGIELSGVFGSAFSIWVIEVDVKETKLLRVTHSPLEIVHQRPRKVALKIAFVDCYRCTEHIYMQHHLNTATNIVFIISL